MSLLNKKSFDPSFGRTKDCPTRDLPLSVPHRDVILETFIMHKYSARKYSHQRPRGREKLVEKSSRYTRRDRESRASARSSRHNSLAILSARLSTNTSRCNQVTVRRYQFARLELSTLASRLCTPRRIEGGKGTMRLKLRTFRCYALSACRRKSPRKWHNPG